jgi:lysophospholipase L1-like esterase
MHRRLVLVAAFLVATSSALAASFDLPVVHWVATWTASPLPPGSTFNPAPLPFDNQTIRHIVRVSAGGWRVRARFSNAFGTTPLRIGSAHIARHAAAAAIVPGTDHALTFGGRPTVTVPAGAVVVSDPVDLDVATHGRLAVSLYLPEPTGPPTYHEVTRQTSYVSGPGDFAGEIEFPIARSTVSRYFLSVVEVQTWLNVGTVVAFGDSITVGATSTVDEYRTWPDVLSTRLNRRGVTRAAVVNQGVGCGRLLFDQCGQSGSARFDRDVLTASGARHVIVALGLNDIGIPVIFNRPSQLVSADDIIVGLRQLIERARAQHLRVHGATITPVGASVFPGFFTPENEAKRQAVNAWIRTSGEFDSVIDFDAVVRDPAEPTRLRPDFSSLDGVHPSNAGYQAMANAIDLSLFR